MSEHRHRNDRQRPSAQARCRSADQPWRVSAREAGYTGTHLACEHGVCGACTVIVDGSAVRSCLMLAVQAEAAEITTVEGLAERGRNAPSGADRRCATIRPAMRLLHAGCRDDPGRAHRAMVPSRAKRRWSAAMSGHICRCTGYQGIRRAIRQLAGGSGRNGMNVQLSTGAHRYIGERIPRKEDPRLLTGRGQFVDDISLPGMLHCAFARSPIARGTIVSIDTAAARELPGVHAVYTADGLRAHPLNVHELLLRPGDAPVTIAGRRPCRLCRRSGGDGHRRSRAIAEDAASLIEVEIRRGRSGRHHGRCAAARRSIPARRTTSPADGRRGDRRGAEGPSTMRRTWSRTRSTTSASPNRRWRPAASSPCREAPRN